MVHYIVVDLSGKKETVYSGNSCEEAIETLEALPLGHMRQYNFYGPEHDSTMYMSQCTWKNGLYRIDENFSTILQEDDLEVIIAELMGE